MFFVVIRIVDCLLWVKWPFKIVFLSISVRLLEGGKENRKIG